MASIMDFLIPAKKTHTVIVLFTLILAQCALHIGSAQEATVSKSDLTLLVDETELLSLTVVGDYNELLTLHFIEQHDDIVQVNPSDVPIEADSTNLNQSRVRTYNINILGKSPGHVEITANVTPGGYISTDNLFMRVTVQHSNAIYHISNVVGWIYFIAWSVSFYPQIYINYKRKSVIGLNFDFISLNIVGFILYSLFNLGLYFIPEVKDEYFERHPRGLNPVQVNDIVFALHASLATFFTICQCYIYQRGNQTVSTTARVILGIFAIIVIICVILSSTLVITWLDFLYACSYIKLAITLIKYVPQAYMNYKRKSTVGWSIGNIFLDFVGGTLSMLQMILNAHNYNDWVSIFGDPTKFGLGLFSVVFDIFFIIQHYILYRNMEPYETIDGDDIEE